MKIRQINNYKVFISILKVRTNTKPKKGTAQCAIDHL